MTISRTYGAAVEDVWDACTNPERISRWFLPVSGGLRLGGRFQLQGNAGGTIERCDPPKSFFATWEFGGEVSWIEVRLTAEAAEEMMRLSGERWCEAHIASDEDEAQARAMAGRTIAFYTGSPGEPSAGL